MLDDLTTEARNPASAAIDALSAVEIVHLMNGEDRRVAQAVAGETASIARTIEAIADRLRQGGRLIYLGAGTSGRLGVLDASECPPTFNAPPHQVVGLIAGGRDALTRSIEGAEDHPEFAVRDLQQVALDPADVLVGIATSGRTPYVIGGMEYARQLGVFTVGLSCNEDSELAQASDLTITPVVGPEVVSGSTRLKAGTATKMVLNMLTTGAMVLLGKTYGNLMVDLQTTNRKLTDRARRIAKILTGRTDADAEDLLHRCNGELKTAVVVHHCTVTPEVARQLLDQHQGQLRRVLEQSGLDEDRSRPDDWPDGTCETAATPVGRAPSVSKLSGDDLVLGIDAGGSRTRAWLALRSSTDPTVCGRGSAGPGNPIAVGFDQALANLDQAIDRAWCDAQRKPVPVASVCLAVAGSDREEVRTRFQQWAAVRPLAQIVQIVPDVQAVLAKGTPDGWGVALVVGTGSLALGMNPSGQTARAGGWGRWFGDEGSGYAIALAGLRAAARSADGRGPETTICQGFLDRLRLSTPQQLVAKLCQPAWDASSIAGLAPIVLEAAAQGDQVAVEIIDAAASELAGMIAAVAARLGWKTEPFPLAFAGGVIRHQPLLRHRIIERSQQHMLKPMPVTMVEEPIRGALRLARTASRLPTNLHRTSELQAGK